jgi:hypothetical protein
VENINEANEETAKLMGTVGELTNEVARLRSALRDAKHQANLAVQARTVEALENLISKALPFVFDRVETDEDVDGDLVLTLVGVRQDDDGKLVPPMSDYEVHARMEMDLRFWVRAGDQADAEGFAENILIGVGDEIVGRYDNHCIADEEGASPENDSISLSVWSSNIYVCDEQ